MSSSIRPVEASLDVRLLLDHPALRSLAADDAALIASELERQDFYSDQLVVEEGSTDRALYLVLSGSARLVRGGDEAGVLEPGAYFGELGLIAGKRRPSSVFASGPLATARLTRERFDALAARRP